MKTAASFTLVLIAVACLVALAIGIYPGVLIDLLTVGFFLSFLVAPILGVVLLIALLVLASKGKLGDLKYPWRHTIVGLAMLFVTFVLLKLYIPQRIAFAVSRPQFEQLLVQAPELEQRGAPLNRRLGVYTVDEYAADPRGGVFFRAYSGADGIGPDTMSYGFAYKPNVVGTPFGAASYRLHRLGSDWYWFNASNDWY